MVAPHLAAVFTKLQTLSISDYASVVSMNIFCSASLCLHCDWSSFGGE